MRPLEKLEKVPIRIQENVNLIYYQFSQFMDDKELGSIKEICKDRSGSTAPILKELRYCRSIDFSPLKQ